MPILDELSYSTLNTNPEQGRTQLDNSGYEFYINNGASFAVVEQSHRNWGQDPDEQSPWKIHLSVAPEDVGKAWELVYPMLMENDVPSFKVTKLSVAAADDSASAKRVSEGSQITVYIPYNEEAKYNHLIGEIEQVLAANGIKPGAMNESDRKLGTFCSIRGAGVVMSERYNYIPASDDYNPHRLQDPFVAQESEFLNTFAKAVEQYLQSDFAQKKIAEAIESNQTGMLSRIFDDMKFDDQITTALLNNTQHAADANNLPAYLNQVARGGAQILLNTDNSGLNERIINAIGKDNYDKLDKEQVKEHLLKGILVLHGQEVNNAFQKANNITLDSGPMSDEVTDNLIAFNENIAMPGMKFTEQLSADSLATVYKQPEATTPDHANEQQINPDLEKLKAYRKMLSDAISQLQRFQQNNNNRLFANPEHKKIKSEAIDIAIRSMEKALDKIEEAEEKINMPNNKQSVDDSLSKIHEAVVTSLETNISNNANLPGLRGWAEKIKGMLVKIVSLKQNKYENQAEKTVNSFKEFKNNFKHDKEESINQQAAADQEEQEGKHSSRLGA